MQGCHILNMSVQVLKGNYAVQILVHLAGIAAVNEVYPKSVLFAVEENTESIDFPLHDAAKRGNIDFLRECLANRVSPRVLCCFTVLCLTVRLPSHALHIMLYSPLLHIRLPNHALHVMLYSPLPHSQTS